jgi:hypothetical protein
MGEEKSCLYGDLLSLTNVPRLSSPATAFKSDRSVGPNDPLTEALSIPR